MTRDYGERELESVGLLPARTRAHMKHTCRHAQARGPHRHAWWARAAPDTLGNGGQFTTNRHCDSHRSDSASCVSCR